MLKYAAEKLLLMVPTLLALITMVFLMLRVLPGDPALLVLGDQLDESALQQIRHEMGLDKPLILQYFDFLWGVVRLDLGKSILTRRPVVTEIGDQVVHTFVLATASLIVAVSVAVPLGVISAIKRNSPLDQVLRVVALLGISMPEFWKGLLALWLFGLVLGWFPIIGAGKLSAPLEVLRHLVLPAVTMGYGFAALIMRMTRSCMLEVISQDYIRTARAKGLRERVVVYRHALKNALIPVVTIIGLSIGWLLGGSVVVEMVFSRPGLGKLLVDAMYSRDYAQAQASLMLFAVIFMVANLAADLVYGLVDPRIKYE